MRLGLDPDIAALDALDHAKAGLFEPMVKDVLDRLAANPKLQAETALISGFYD
jgi:hypothetical protein